MSKKSTEQNEESLTQFLVPAAPAVEAKDLEDLGKKLKQSKKEEVGDGVES